MQMSTDQLVDDKTVPYDLLNKIVAVDAFCQTLNVELSDQ